jgi:methylthioribose-1-phosphate isomerase
MKVNGKEYRTIWLDQDNQSVNVIDQTALPHRFNVIKLKKLDDACTAISNMIVRGAPLIGATAAYGIALATQDSVTNQALTEAADKLALTRPTAINLKWALDKMIDALICIPEHQRKEIAYQLAKTICDNDVETNTRIAEAGFIEISKLWVEAKARKDHISILTHCNAGWLATVDWGTALAPIYKAFDNKIPIHVFVDETRPRNQGANLTAWELKSHGVPHTLIVDNAGGHLMQKGLIDLCIVGADRVTRDASVCNKIGTYLKALAAKDNNVPFYVAFPSSTIDWKTSTGAMIPIEDRGSKEITHIAGKTRDGNIQEILIAPEGVSTCNPGFDVTPHHLVTAFLTERGRVPAQPSAFKKAFSM